jgi:ATP phosphoribosyltransferase
MKKYNLIPPEGTHDLLLEECTARREIENKLMKLFSENGYSEVITPFVEFADVFETSERHFSDKNLYKLTDSKNRLLVIRPDSTLPIIRLAETRLKNAPRPLKLCYNQTIYRVNPKDAGRDDEIAQCGVECIYDNDVTDNHTIVQLAKAALESVAEFTGCESHFETVELKSGDKHTYYTTSYFKGYIEGYGKPILTGGTYLVNDTHAQGFAVNVSAITSCRVLASAKSDAVKIALTKGRVEKEAIKLFSRMGWDVSGFANKGRQLIFTVPDVNVEIMVAKSPDVISFVENGDCDIGITGKDMIEEYGGEGKRYHEVLDLQFGKCRFALAAPKGVDFYSGHKIKTVASKYTAVARRFFLQQKGMDINVRKIEGSVELLPLIGSADGIVDIVETGATLRENGLEVVEYINDISTRVILNPVKMKMRKTQIDEILTAMEGAIET